VCFNSASIVIVMLDHIYRLALQGENKDLFEVRSSTWAGGRNSRGKLSCFPPCGLSSGQSSKSFHASFFPLSLGLFTKQCVSNGTLLNFEGFFLPALVEDAMRMPAYRAGRVIFTGLMLSERLFWYFAVNTSCLAGFANDIRGAKRRTANAIIVMVYEEDKLERPVLKITRNLKPGQTVPRRIILFTCLLTRFPQTRKSLYTMDRTTSSVAEPR